MALAAEEREKREDEGDQRDCESAAREAMRVSGGSLEAAANYLLTSDVAAAGPPRERIAGEPSARTDQIETVACPISQYSVDDGRSACTCM